MHRGAYHPIWLLEEPESFLHADISTKLGALLASDQWASSIQMFISTHSPIILAASKGTGASGRWIVFDNHSVAMNKTVADIEPSDINVIGVLMGDSNFETYFLASGHAKIVVLEDSSDYVKELFERSGVSVSAGANGIGEVKRHICALKALPSAIHS